MTIGEPPSEPLLAPRATVHDPPSRERRRTGSFVGGIVRIALVANRDRARPEDLDRSRTPALAYLHGVTVPLSRSCCEARAGNRSRASLRTGSK